MIKELQNAISKLEEDFLVNKLICPLLEIIHPGRIEFTHSSNEAGRDIISFGKDALGRDDILCIQAKANKVTYGAQFNGIVTNPAQMAKTEGVVLANGQKVHPNEVWFVTSSPFPANKRVIVADTLKKLEQDNIKFIPGEEFTELVFKHLRDIARKLLAYSDGNIIEIISEFSQHSDGIAFNLPQTRKIDDFYITASLTPFSNFAHKAISEHIDINDIVVNYTEKLSSYLLNNSDVLSVDIQNIIIKEQKRRISESKFIDKYKVTFDVDLTNIIYKEDSIPIEIDFAYYKTSDNLKKSIQFSFVSFCEKTYLKNYFTKLRKDTIGKIDNCPDTLETTTSDIINVCESIELLDTFLMDVIKKLPVETQNTLTYNSNPLDLKIMIPDPKNLLLLSKILLIEGQPGCGKTTLLRRLFVSLLEEKRSAVYVPCCKIDKSHIDGSLNKIIEKYGVGYAMGDDSSDLEVVILDGLDEAPFDLLDLISKVGDLYNNIVISSRSSYCTTIRGKYFNVMLAPFNTTERDAFFKKMLSDDEATYNKALHLFEEYPDVDEHTKLPLIATLTVSLLKSDIEPTTRSEIYNYRLKLLLSKWDHAKNVTRIKTDNPSAKLRFLEFLAFQTHSAKQRKRFFSESEMEDAFGKSLGSWGSKSDYDDFFHDLVKCNGIIHKISDNLYSFGHLSFQEHLAGEYLNKNSTVETIWSYLGNDWWCEPINFWASTRGSVTDLLDLIMDKPVHSRVDLKQLKEVIQYAPYTSPGAVDIILDDDY